MAEQGEVPIIETKSRHAKKHSIDTPNHAHNGKFHDMCWNQSIGSTNKDFYWFLVLQSSQMFLRPITKSNIHKKSWRSSHCSNLIAPKRQSTKQREPPKTEAPPYQKLQSVKTSQQRICKFKACHLTDICNCRELQGTCPHCYQLKKRFPAKRMDKENYRIGHLQ